MDRSGMSLETHPAPDPGWRLRPVARRTAASAFLAPALSVMRAHRRPGAASLGGDPADRLAGGLFTFTMRNVGQRDDADQALVPVQYRQPVDLVVAHVLGDIGDLVVLEAELHVLAHHLPHLGGVGRFALGNGADGDVPVG